MSHWLWYRFFINLLLDWLLLKIVGGGIKSVLTLAAYNPSDSCWVVPWRGRSRSSGCWQVPGRPCTIRGGPTGSMWWLPTRWSRQTTAAGLWRRPATSPCNKTRTHVPYCDRTIFRYNFFITGFSILVDCWILTKIKHSGWFIWVLGEDVPIERHAN